jgi:hypothetical protein
MLSIKYGADRETEALTIWEGFFFFDEEAGFKRGSVCPKGEFAFFELNKLKLMEGGDGF